MKTRYLMAIDVGEGSGRWLLLDPDTGLGGRPNAVGPIQQPQAPAVSGMRSTPLTS